MEVNGRKLRAEVRVQAIKLGLLKFRTRIRNAIAGKVKITIELMQELVGLEALDKEDELRREPRKKQTGAATAVKCSKWATMPTNVRPKKEGVSQMLEKSEIINKSSNIYCRILLAPPIPLAPPYFKKTTKKTSNTNKRIN